MNGEIVETLAMANTGAGGKFIDQNYAKAKNFTLKKLIKPLKVFNVDGTPNKKGTITHYTSLYLKILDRTTLTHFLLTGLGKQKIILGFPWFEEQNPLIDWRQKTIQWRKKSKYHLSEYLAKRRLNKLRPTIETILEEDEDNTNPIPEWYPIDSTIIQSSDIANVHALAMQLLESRKPRSSSTEEQGGDDLIISFLNGEPSQETEDIWIDVALTHSQAFELKYKEVEEEKAIEDRVPKAYHEFLSVFDEKAASRFPESRPWDHKIDLKEGFEPKSSKVYPLTQAEELSVKEFIEENLAKGYIRPSDSPQASGFFFVPKKDGKKRPCQDYRYINLWTRKNAYPLPLVSDLMDKLKGARYFTKLDVLKGYNNVRIREGDEWKAAFKTKFGLFEPTVMFFGLCNSPATFQAMMDMDCRFDGWDCRSDSSKYRVFCQTTVPCPSELCHH